MSVFSLSIHADYRCRHSGACCTADWDVPVELPIFRSLRDALAAGRVQPAAAGDGPLITEPDLPDDAAAMLGRTPSGDCVFFERGSHLCVIHRDVGEAALPSTCRHFPRLALRDRRGTFITLSHFCPTAAAMLFRDDSPLAVVESPPAFPASDYEGLVVEDDAWPPLLHPRMLMDLDGYTAWERHMVARCAGDGRPESIVATLARDARLLRRWTPGRISQADAVAALPDGIVEAPAWSVEADLRDRAEVIRAVPDDLKPAADEDGVGPAFARYVAPAWDEFRRPIARFVAAKAFAAWTAYQGRGVATIVRGLDAALAVLRLDAARGCRDAARRLDADLLREAFRRTDFLLNHLAVGEELAREWSAAEGPGGVGRGRAV